MEYSLGLIGYPLQQSLSPRLHGAALEAMGLRGEYRLYPTPPLPEGAKRLAETIDRVRAGEIQGLNVTIPHKQAVLAYLDRLTPEAEVIGAANTLYCEDGVLVGDNSDAPGFLSDLNRQLAQAGMSGEGVERKALVLGAGGAARAVVYALWQAGWGVTVASRRPEQAAELVGHLQQYDAGRAVKSGSLAALALDGDHLQAYLSSQVVNRPGSANRQLDVLVNASAGGMIPEVDVCPWPAGIELPQGYFVYDIVYKPRETRLLRNAREAGLPAANGLGMLVEQAALALERWTGQSVPRAAMWQALDGGAG